MDENVERRIRFQEQLTPAHVATILNDPALWLVHDTAYHDDGSASDTFYLELSAEQYKALRVYGGD